MVDSRIKKMRCPNVLCLGVCDLVGRYEYWCKVCGTRWLIKELVITTHSKKKPFESGIPGSEYNPHYLYENQKNRRGRY